jgi:hypothetical protein
VSISSTRVLLRGMAAPAPHRVAATGWCGERAPLRQAMHSSGQQVKWQERAEAKAGLRGDGQTDRNAESGSRSVGK